MKKRRKLKVLATVFTVVTTLLIISGCQSEYNALDNPDLERTPLPPEELPPIGTEGFGFVFGVVPVGEGLANPTFDPDNLEAYVPSTGQYQFESTKDAMQVIFHNVSHEPRNFLLKVFLNYEEASFRILGTEEYVTEFHFTVEGGYEIKIPFTLDLDPPYEDYTYRLTATLFAEPHLHSMIDNSDLLSESFAPIVGVDLVFGAGSPISLATRYNYIPLERSYFRGIAPLNIRPYALPTLDSLWEGSDFHWYDPPIQVERGSEVTFSYFASPTPMFINLEDITPEFIAEHPEVIVQNYVIVALLDWQPLEINGKPFLFVEIEDPDRYHPTDFGWLTFTVPDEPGFYEFIGILSPNATIHSTAMGFFSPRASFRLTLEVIE